MVLKVAVAALCSVKRLLCNVQGQGYVVCANTISFKRNGLTAAVNVINKEDDWQLKAGKKSINVFINSQGQCKAELARGRRTDTTATACEWKGGKGSLYYSFYSTPGPPRPDGASRLIKRIVHVSTIIPYCFQLLCYYWTVLEWILVQVSLDSLYLFMCWKGIRVITAHSLTTTTRVFY